MKQSKFSILYHWFLPITLPLALVLSAGSLAAGSCPEPNNEALQWLDKMTRSAQEVSYSGVVTFQLGDDMQVVQISHSVDNSAASESLTELTGQGASVIRVEHPLDCIHPGHKLLRLAAKISTSADSSELNAAGSCGISGQYSFRVTEGERVAGRQAVRLIISPRDMYRYGYVMELDQQTGLLLKARTIGRGNKVLERFQFANISYTEQNFQTERTEVVHLAAHSKPDDHHREPSADSYTTGSWAVRWLPRGFTPTDSPSAAELRRTYTDGLAVFSVFLEMLPGEIKPGEGVVRHGGTTSYTRGMHMAGKPALVTVIGEVPINTARMVADSIRWVQ